MKWVRGVRLGYWAASSPHPALMNHRGLSVAAARSCLLGSECTAMHNSPLSLKPPFPPLPVEYTQQIGYCLLAAILWQVSQVLGLDVCIFPSLLDDFYVHVAVQYFAVNIRFTHITRMISCAWCCCIFGCFELKLKNLKTDTQPIRNDCCADDARHVCVRVPNYSRTASTPPSYI